MDFLIFYNCWALLPAHHHFIQEPSRFPRQRPVASIRLGSLRGSCRSRGSSPPVDVHRQHLLADGFYFSDSLAVPSCSSAWWWLHCHSCEACLLTWPAKIHSFALKVARWLQVSLKGQRLELEVQMKVLLQKEVPVIFVFTLITRSSWMPLGFLPVFCFFFLLTALIACSFALITLTSVYRSPAAADKWQWML